MPPDFDSDADFPSPAPHLREMPSHHALSPGLPPPATPPQLAPEDLSVDPAPTAPAAPRIKDLPESERPREKLMAHGAGSLTDAELLALFFRTGTVGLTAIDIGREMLRRYGSLNAISRQTWKELSRQRGLGPAKAMDLLAAVELGRRLAREEFMDASMDSPEAIVALMGPEMRGYPREVLKVLSLNVRCRVISVDEITRGTVSETIAHPREILRPAVLHSATGIIIVHNHPSGDASPSQADIQFTRRAAGAADIFQIRLHDHVIIGQPGAGREGFFSFRQAGLI